MARNGFATMSVDDVLSESGLSTRAFYRHFDTREALLSALLRRDTESVRDALEHAVANAIDAVAAVDAWLEGYLDVFYEPRRAARTALFSSSAVTASLPEVHEMRRIVCRPLIDALRAGHEAKILYSPNPVADGYTMFALIQVVFNTKEASFPSRSAAKAHVLRFALPAFQLPVAADM